MKIKYMFLIRNIRLIKCYALWKQDLSSNWRCKIHTGAYIKNRRWKNIMWFNEAYIKNIFVKSIFKTFTLENSKKKRS